ncbi:MAG: DUF4176 domain-containing protein [Defluviitaleaceae bacterium]|nr:DUF4176 domain-containing protein [Defluviitaleaceae bacterium]
MGVCQMQPTAEGDVLWDYVGCLYPEGNMGVDQTYLFNGSQIEQVFSLGFQDEEGRAFKAEADEVLKRLRGE